ncbi:TetR/AcrR family transcriptional regulator [Actinomadura keratinilytica]|uniref:TetR/AcrR family transcriptional regulator n=1 Tax=Actinomadura keratinilytica TaxID=547461 RepID=UPI00360EDEB6
MARPRTTSDEAILQATGRALLRHGPGRLTLGGVAAEAGLSPATLVQRFGSKRGLLLAFARRAAEHAREPFDRARREHPRPWPPCAPPWPPWPPVSAAPRRWPTAWGCCSWT